MRFDAGRSSRKAMGSAGGPVRRPLPGNGERKIAVQDFLMRPRRKFQGRRPTGGCALRRPVPQAQPKAAPALAPPAKLLETNGYPERMLNAGFRCRSGGPAHGGCNGSKRPRPGATDRRGLAARQPSKRSQRPVPSVAAARPGASKGAPGPLPDDPHPDRPCPSSASDRRPPDEHRPRGPAARRPGGPRTSGNALTALAAASTSRSRSCATRAECTFSVAADAGAR